MPINIICPICGQTKALPPSTAKTRKHCSKRCYVISQKGKDTWNKNLHGWRTPEHSANLRKSIIERNKKYPLTPDKARINGIQAKVARGEIHYRWRGGITPENRKIRNSVKYENWRRQVFEKDNFTCQRCGQQGGYLQAHHLKPFYKHPELRFDVSNGITHCLRCHHILHANTDWHKLHRELNR